MAAAHRRCGLDPALPAAHAARCVANFLVAWGLSGRGRGLRLGGVAAFRAAKGLAPGRRGGFPGGIEVSGDMAADHARLGWRGLAFRRCFPCRCLAGVGSPLRREPSTGHLLELSCPSSHSNSRLFRGRLRRRHPFLDFFHDFAQSGPQADGTVSGGRYNFRRRRSDSEDRIAHRCRRQRRAW
jgi:hypothetical protein